MKKHLLFIPDIFLVMLIIFSCERMDLTEWRNSTDNFPYSNQNTTDLNKVTLDSVSSTPDVDIWKNHRAVNQERAKIILGNFRILEIGEN
ncbi:hypothetical protein [Lunatibacter salilacus]|uniref:hypothetical protein n=1 Tax=Lunatibacter salilacus TaxID=2483804 RepID=UPI00131D9577|nr:hypothetical protein [Lunatibacter salilacus]